MSGKVLGLTLTGLTLLSATLLTTQADAASIIRKYQYFPVYGTTAEQLDKSLAKNGPKLQDGGESHPGATKIAFDARVKYKYDDKYCRISGVFANVHATVSLPKWKNRKRASADTVLIWDTLVRDIRRHEESHIIIARVHASELERQIRTMRSERDCAKLRAGVDKITDTIFAAHEKAQQQFDRVETINFEARFERLLTYSLQRRLNQQKNNS